MMQDSVRISELVDLENAHKQFILISKKVKVFILRESRNKYAK
jgi:hypothetical protein